ncbi:MAG: N-acyl homoserine lactonase family protein, partial [Deltaproteobacteria bacterium]|nr:N-acyl homoserine lactonase family protein [Deltaproteobacteria bacterium]
KVPVPAFLIEHPRGRVLFDSGLHPDAAVDPVARLGRLSRFFEVDYGAGQDVASRLEAIDVARERVDFLVLSHLHFDHAGGCGLIPDARVVVQRREWEAGGDDDLAASNGFDPRDYRHGHDLLLADGEHDLFGDGRVVCVPTFGHTPGHQSLRVRPETGGEVVMCADACYLRRNLDEMRLPGVVFDRDAMMASLGALGALRTGGAAMIYGHDPQEWKAVRQAPCVVGGA